MFNREVLFHLFTYTLPCSRTDLRWIVDWYRKRWNQMNNKGRGKEDKGKTRHRKRKGSQEWDRLAATGKVPCPNQGWLCSHPWAFLSLIGKKGSKSRSPPRPQHPLGCGLNLSGHCLWQIKAPKILTLSISTIIFIWIENKSVKHQGNLCLWGT